MWASLGSNIKFANTIIWTTSGSILLYSGYGKLTVTEADPVFTPSSSVIDPRSPMLSKCSTALGTSWCRLSAKRRNLKTSCQLFLTLESTDRWFCDAIFHVNSTPSSVEKALPAMIKHNFRTEFQSKNSWWMSNLVNRKPTFWMSQALLQCTILALSLVHRVHVWRREWHQHATFHQWWNLQPKPMPCFVDVHETPQLLWQLDVNSHCNDQRIPVLWILDQAGTMS